jgi:prepilin-type N-terminal cleavage/methylation domain-containing protein
MKRRGFTLLEVMIALALLGFALVVLMRSTASNIQSSQAAHMMGIATDLARGKMYEIEELLIKDGFSDTDQSQLDPKPFDTEGWPDVTYAYKVEVVEMPSYDVLQQMANGQAVAMGSAAALGSAMGSDKPSLLGSGFSTLQELGMGSNDPLSKFQNSALGGMLTMMGGLGAGAASGGNGVLGAQAGALIQSQYTMFQQILKVSVRKVTLTVNYKVLGNDREIKLVCFFTDPQAMDQILNGAGATDIGDTSGGSGSGTGSGTGSGSGRTTTKTGSGS